MARGTPVSGRAGAVSVIGVPFLAWLSTGKPCQTFATGPYRWQSGPGERDAEVPQLPDVAEVLNISGAQVYALVRRGELRAIKIGGRGQWRVEASELEAYIQRAYADADKFVGDHPFVEGTPAKE